MISRIFPPTAIPLGVPLFFNARESADLVFLSFLVIVFFTAEALRTQRDSLFFNARESADLVFSLGRYLKQSPPKMRQGKTL